MCILRPFFCRAWIDLFFQAWLVKIFHWGFLIYSNFETNIERLVARVDCKDVRYKTYWPGCVSHTFSWAQKLQLAPSAMWQLFGQKNLTGLQTMWMSLNWLVMLAWKFSSATQKRNFEPKMLKIDIFPTFLHEIAHVCTTNVHKLLKWSWLYPIFKNMRVFVALSLQNSWFNTCINWRRLWFEFLKREERVTKSFSLP